MVSALETRRRALMFQPHRATATGAIASFRTDVISPLKMQFDLVPVQDLHGQANPYPAGGGKNKLDESAYTSLTQATYSNHVFTGTDDGGNGQAVFVRTFKNGTTVNTYRLNKANVTVGSRNGVTVPFDDTFDSMDIGYLMSTADNFCARFTKPNLPDGNYTVSFKVDVFPEQGTYGKFSYIQLEAGSSKTDYAPYENLCPITGHDGFTRTGTGKNLWNFLKSGQDINPSGVDTTNKIIEIRAYDDRNKNITNGLKFKENTQYTVILKLYRSNGTTSGTSYGSNVGVEYTDGTKTVITYVSAGDSVFATTVFTTNATKTVKCISVFNNSGYSYIKYEESGIFEGVLTADQFASYVGHSYETTFPTPPGTVYGGHVTDNGDGTGTLTVDRAIYTITGNETWTEWGNAYFSNVLSVEAVNNGKSVNCIASMLAGAATVNLYGSGKGVGIRNLGVYIDSNSYANRSALVGMTIAYKRANPVTYTLSLDAIQSLIGQNHVWVDNADEVSVEYWGH